MLSKLTKRLRGGRGFTLIELLVTMLLIAILAAIAIPAYLAHQKKGHDADAESNARNLVSKVELCYATQEDYSQCDTAAELGSDLSLPYGTNPGEVSVVSASKGTFKVTGVSTSSSDGSNHTFSITKSVSGTNDRTCTAGATNDNGACRNGNW
ncbi:MAG: type pilus assembly protein PilA [Thermoleophilaceae bacterium]|nr:type pilus assembly protein PilA [Thermoleophilaceae bacterium]